MVKRFVINTGTVRTATNIVPLPQAAILNVTSQTGVKSATRHGTGTIVTHFVKPNPLVNLHAINLLVSKNVSMDITAWIVTPSAGRTRAIITLVIKLDRKFVKNISMEKTVTSMVSSFQSVKRYESRFEPRACDYFLYL